MKQSELSGNDADTDCFPYAHNKIVHENSDFYERMLTIQFSQ